MLKDVNKLRQNYFKYYIWVVYTLITHKVMMIIYQNVHNNIYS